MAYPCRSSASRASVWRLALACTALAFACGTDGGGAGDATIEDVSDDALVDAVDRDVPDEADAHTSDPDVGESDADVPDTPADSDADADDSDDVPDSDAVDVDATDAEVADADADTADAVDPDAADVDGDAADVPDAVDADVADADADTADVPDAVDADATDADGDGDASDVPDADADVTDADVTDADTADVPDLSDAPDIADVTDASDAPDADPDADLDADALDADVEVDVGPPAACTPPTTAYPAAAPTVMSWVDVAPEAGIGGAQWLGLESFRDSPCGETALLAGGAAVADYDEDGDMDIFVPRLGLPDQFYQNNGDGTFTDIAAELGLASEAHANGAAWVDIDADGDLDLYVTTLTAPQNYLYLQPEAGPWVESAADFGLDFAGPGDRNAAGCGNMFSAAFFDGDGDGDLDMYQSRWITGAWAWGSRYMRNDDGYYVDASVELGLWPGETRSVVFGSSWFDFDDDDDLDVLLTADFETSRFYEQDGGVFVEQTDESGLGTDENGMGVAVADVDRDGDLDIFTTAIYGEERLECGFSWGCTGNRMYINTGDLRFVDCTDSYGVRDSGWGWGTAFFDADQDGDLDLATASGYWVHWEEPSGFDRLREALVRYEHGGMRLFLREGDTMQERSREVGFVNDRRGRSVIPFDYDGDGDLDVFVPNNLNEPVLLENRGNEDRHWVRLELRQPGPNTHAIGASVWMQPGDGMTWQRAEISASAAFLTTLPLMAHFGLGDYEGPLNVRVVWPDGTESTHTIGEVDQLVRIERTP